MGRPRISPIRPWLPWTWRVGGPLAAVVAIQLELASVGLAILGWSIFFDIRWWYQGRRRA